MVKEICANAFNSGALQFTRTLAIYNLKALSLHSDMFNGLQSLQNLYLYKVHIITFPTYFLKLIGQRLNQLMVYRATSTAVAEIASLTGSTYLFKLEWTRVMGNLRDTLNEYTFIGICETVIVLELSSSGIQSIGPRTFDKMKSLQLLSLDKNQLTTVGGNLFDAIYRNQNISIILYDNPWDCDCNLVDFRNDLHAYPLIFAGNDLVCETPSSLKGYKVKLSEFVCNPLVDQLFLPVFETNIMCWSPSSTIESPVGYAVYTQMQVILKRKTTIIQSLQNGDFKMQTNSTINTQTWFTWITRNLHSTPLPPIADLIICRPSNCFQVQYNRSYTVCWLDQWRSAVSPYDCVSVYAKAIVVKNWLPSSYKNVISTGAGLAMVGVMFVGIFIGILCIKYYDTLQTARLEKQIEHENEVYYYTIDEATLNLCNL